MSRIGGPRWRRTTRCSHSADETSSPQRCGSSSEPTEAPITEIRSDTVDDVIKIGRKLMARGADDLQYGKGP
ncbi:MULTISPECIES: hypothetical protein [unclassified Kribbella]|uniref:hypothetical protein n=1 Tax=unclassified Kribbella TaxID=2644121 RepID=UPI003077B361